MDMQFLWVRGGVTERCLKQREYCEQRKKDKKRRSWKYLYERELRSLLEQKVDIMKPVHKRLWMPHDLACHISLRLSRKQTERKSYMHTVHGVLLRTPMREWRKLDKWELDDVFFVNHSNFKSAYWHTGFCICFR